MKKKDSNFTKDEQAAFDKLVRALDGLKVCHTINPLFHVIFNTFQILDKEDKPKFSSSLISMVATMNYLILNPEDEKDVKTSKRPRTKK